MKQLYVVTGTSGYLGRAICGLLNERECEIRALARSEQSVRDMPSGIRFYRADVCDASSLDALFEDTRGARVTVIHSAALVSVARRDKKVREVNIEGTRNIIEKCKAHGAAKLVYVSSTDALHPKKDAPTTEPDEYLPTRDMGSDYAYSKAEASRLVTEAARDGLNATLVLPSCILGPGDYRAGFTSNLISVYINGMPPISIRGGYDFVDVRDVALGALAAENAPSGESYILSGRFATITEVFNTLADFAGKPHMLLTLPTLTLRAASAVMAPYYAAIKKQSPLTQNSVDLLAGCTHFSHEKATRELGYTPRGLEITLRDTVDFINAHPEIYSKKHKKHI